MSTTQQGATTTNATKIGTRICIELTKMENVRLWVLNSVAVGFSLANINMILSTLVLIASLVWTLIQIKDKFKK